MKNKSDLLVLIKLCEEELTYISSKEMSDDIRKDFEKLINSLKSHYKMVSEFDEKDERINAFYDIYVKLYTELKNASLHDFKDEEKKNLGLTLYTQLKKIDKQTGLIKVENIEHTDDKDYIDVDYEDVEEKVKKKNKKVFGILAGIGAGAVAILIIANLAKENKRLKNEVDKLGDDLLYKNSIIEINDKENEPSDIEKEFEVIDETLNNKEIILDVNNEEVLYEYASLLENSKNLTNEEIIKALKLANFDILQNKDVFTSREDLYESISNLAILTNDNNVDKIVIENKNADNYISESSLKEILKVMTNETIKIDDFSALKEENGYNIYKVYELCAKKLNDVNNENKVLYAKIFNEITTRKFESFSLTPSSPISQYYVMLAMFNENMNASLNLTTNHGWGPTYGEKKDDNTVANGYTGDTIDGSYGYICIEQLIEHLTIGNEDYSMYSIYADEVMINKGLSR